MSFFLLGKGPKGHLKLLSTSAVDGRKEALAELSRITSEPGFSDWDDEVFVIDLAEGTPVLLVRPSDVGNSVVGSEPSRESETSEADKVEENLPAVPAEPLLVEAPEPVIVAPVEVLPVEPAWAEAVAESSLANGTSLTDALLAAAAQREESPAEQHEPESVDEDPEEVVDVASADELEAPEPIDPVLAFQPVNDDEDSDSQAVEEPVIEEVAASGSPEALTGPEGAEAQRDDEAAEHDGGNVITLPTPVAVEPAWPWASLGEPGTAEAVDLEDPAADEGSLIVLPVESDLPEAPRAVILGDYHEPAVADVSVGDAEPALEPSARPQDLEPGADPLDDVAESDDALGDDSDFILDLEALDATDPAVADTSVPAAAPLHVEPEEPVEAPPGYVPSGDAVVDMTCEDCVYVDTCPNKDQRQPSSCGSFQWK